MNIHSPRFLLVYCRFSEEKNKVHVKRKEGDFVQVFPLPILKNECTFNHMRSKGNWKQNAFFEVQSSSDAKWLLYILWYGEPRSTVWGREQSPEQCKSLGLIPSVQKLIHQSTKLSNVLCQRQFQHSVWPLRWHTEKPVLLSLSP